MDTVLYQYSAKHFLQVEQSASPGECENNVSDE